MDCAGAAQSKQGRSLPTLMGQQTYVTLPTTLAPTLRQPVQKQRSRYILITIRLIRKKGKKKERAGFTLLCAPTQYPRERAQRIMLGGKAKLTGLHAATTLRNAAMPTSVFKTIFFTKIFETTSSFFHQKRRKSLQSVGTRDSQRECQSLSSIFHLRS